MYRLELVLPMEEDKKILLEYKREFIESNDSIDGSAGLLDSETFEEWYEAFKDNLSEETVREGLVPSTTYLAKDSNGKLIGMIDIRHRLNDYLLNFGGNIGYSVRASERRKGYGSEMLKLALEKCNELGLKKVLITCNKDNISSSRIILKNGGILENRIEREKRITERYWIKI